MSNDFFDTYDAAAADTLIRSAYFNSIIDAIIAGFDLLPTPDDIAQDSSSYCTATGGPAAYVLTGPASITALTLAAGCRVSFIVPLLNTGACTVNLNGIGAQAVKRQTLTDPTGGDLPLGAIIVIEWDGTQWQLISSPLSDTSAAAASAVAAAASASSASTSASTASVASAAAVNATKKVFQIMVTDPNGAVITSGNGQGPYLSIPVELNGFNLTRAEGSVSTVSSSGALSIQIRRKRAGVDVDMLTSKVSIDANETDSSTGATPMVVDTANDDVATGDQIYVDIDGGGNNAKGLNIRLTFA